MGYLLNSVSCKDLSENEIVQTKLKRLWKLVDYRGKGKKLTSRNDLFI